MTMTFTSTPPVLLTAASVAALPAQALDAKDGVTDQVLWHDGVSTAGVLTIAAGHRLGVHAHRAHHHHIWVVEGGADILDQRVTAGGYAHVPVGVEHDIDATSTDGCKVFYLFMRYGS